MYDLKLRPSAAAVAAAALALTGCAGNEPGPALVDARTAVRAAETDPDVASRAAEELERARGALARAEATFAEEGNSEPEALEHEAYLASRYAEIALAEAEGARLEQEIENAASERSQILIAARSAEAEQARSEARAAEQQAAAAERETEAAVSAARSAAAAVVASQAEARELERRIEQLQAEQTERGLVLTLDDVLFEVDRAVLQPGAESALAELATFLEEYEDRVVLIEGYTDSSGSEAYNRTLSERRANAVRDALIERGIPQARIFTRGLGETDPIASNATAAGRQQNRRVEVVISDEAGSIPGLEQAARLER